jgi:hypothetical protein
MLHTSYCPSFFIHYFARRKLKDLWMLSLFCSGWRMKTRLGDAMLIEEVVLVDEMLLGRTNLS